MKKVFIIGGLGHIGLTLAAVMSDHYKILLFDTNEKAKEMFINENKATFFEPNLYNLLLKNKNNIFISSSLEEVKTCDYVVVTIGTPIDEYLNPKLKQIFSLFKELQSMLTNQTIILRSTVYPGTTKKIEKIFAKTNVKIAFCPERVSGGKMIEEIQILPQIISANSLNAIESASDFFSPLKVKLKILYDSTSGELAKLMTNSYRYIHFAIANQFFMIAKEAECDFYKIYEAITDDYERMKSFPKPFWTSGYCLHKDTIQLASWNNPNTFSLGYDASIVNEYLPLYIFRKIREKFSPIENKTIGLLGMAFKANCDDTRDSLSYRMKKILENEVKCVLCSDLYVKDNSLVSTDFLIQNSDIIILMTNHSEYKNLKIQKPVIDLINFFGNGEGI